MANANRPIGLSPNRYLNNTPWVGGGNVYCIPSTDPNAFAIGDPVVLAGSADASGVAAITLATAGAGNPILGALVSGAGAQTYAGDFGVPAESPIVIPATKTRAYYVLVADDPNILFTIQEDSVGGSIAAASVGLNCDLVAGTNNGYLSGWLLDSSTVNAGSTRQVRIFGAIQVQGNALGTYGKWLVKINNHCYAAGVTGF